jgi:transposase
MSRSSPYVITLADADRGVLGERARSYAAPHGEVVRAKIVLLAADGERNAVIARRLGVHVGVASKWRKRFAEQGLGGLADRKRAGRPRVFPAAVVAQVKAMACEPPAAREVPLSRWSSAELAGQAAAEGLVDSVSASTVRRWLAEDAVKPWQYRSWIFPRDPDFAVRAGRVLDLYERVWGGQELAEDEYVISADEKSQLQALSRCHAGLPAGPRRPGGVRVRAARHAGLPRRLRRAPGAADGHDRAHHRHRPVHRTGDQGDDHRAVRLGQAGVLGRGQRLLPRRAGLDPPDEQSLAHRHAGAPAGARLLAEPGRATRGRMQIAVCAEGGLIDVNGVIPGPVRKDCPRPGVRCR